MSERPFRVLGLQQVALGALDLAPLLALWRDLLGVEVVGQFESSSENVREHIMTLGVGALRVELDLMQPLDPHSKPRVHEPALNHFGIWIDDLPAAYAWLSERGVRFTPGGMRTGAAGHLVCFVHPKPDAEAPISGHGVLLELVQAPAEVILAFATLAEAAKSAP